MKITLLLILLSTLYSCGQRGPASAEATLMVGSAYINLSSQDLDEQQVYAYTLCSALRSKRHSMVMNFLKERFSFKIEAVSCQGEVTEVAIDSQLRKVGAKKMLFFTESKNLFLKPVQTDQDGIFHKFCQDTLLGKQYSGVLADGRAIKFSLLKSEAVLQVTLVLNSGGGIIKEVTTYEFLVDPQVQYYGFVTSLVRQKSCGLGGVSSFHQQAEFVL